ncbi:MAG: hypothetical protein AAB477_00465 [Patescibacteria group bacterium]
MASIVTHALSGTVVALSIPSASVEDKAFLIAGAILPDLIFTPYIISVSRIANKKIKDLTEKDFMLYGYSTPKIRLLKKLYFISHGLPLALLLLVIGNWQQSFLFLSAGFALHILYDLFTHQYEDNNFVPRPLYPISSFLFRSGFTNGWRTTWKERTLSWGIHLIIIMWLV